MVDFLESSDGEFYLLYNCGLQLLRPYNYTDDCNLQSSSAFLFRADIRGFGWLKGHSDGDAREASFYIYNFEFLAMLLPGF